MHTIATLFAFGWAPEIRGITFVLIMVLMLMGSTYLILATNVGARLGLLVALAAFFGWMMSMGAIWAVYGIGLQGKFPSWVGKEIVNDGDLSQAANAIIQNPGIVDATTDQRFGGWILLEPDNPKRGQAVAAADEILVADAGLQAGSFEAVNVFDKGGMRYPFYVEFGNNGEWHMDWFSFWHEPHYALVEVKPLVQQTTEAGKAPPRPIVDESAPSRFVLMERDLGNRRRPAFLITFGSGIIFAVLCWMLHRRDALVERNRSEETLPAKVTVGAGV